MGLLYGRAGRLTAKKWRFPARADHKNVLGLPFITTGDFYFADATKTVYFKAGA